MQINSFHFFRTSFLKKEKLENRKRIVDRWKQCIKRYSRYVSNFKQLRCWPNKRQLQIKTELQQDLNPGTP